MKTETKTVVIYHRADFDGIFCREIARKFLGDAAVFIGWDYGDPVPSPDQVSAEDTVYMLDISIEGLMGHPKLIWIDHHKSAIEKFPTTIPGYRIDGVAACRLAYQWFYRVKQGMDMPVKQEYLNRTLNEPYAVQLAGEYDIWDKRNPEAETFQFGLRAKELEATDWQELLAGDVEGAKFTAEVVRVGRALQTYQQGVDAGTVKHRSFTVKFAGLVFLALNTARCNSLTFAAAVKPEHDALMGFYWTGTSWKVSLYHAPGQEHHDLSQIAVTYGGGGHRGACGFEVGKMPVPIPTLPFPW